MHVICSTAGAVRALISSPTPTHAPAAPPQGPLYSRLASFTVRAAVRVVREST